MTRRCALAAIVLVAVLVPCFAGEAKVDPLAAITKRLATTRVSIAADKEDPDKVFDLIRDGANVNIVVEPEVRKRWDVQTVTLKLKDVSALSAFYHVVRQLDLVAAFANEAFVLTTPEKAQPLPKITMYDIRDITEATRGFRTEPDILGAQVDPTYHYYRRYDRVVMPEYRTLQQVVRDLDEIQKPLETFGPILAGRLQEALKAKHPNVTVSYHDGYLVVVEQPKAARLPITPEEQEKAAGAK